VVDDEPGLREAVKDYLQESGFTVQVASNAREEKKYTQGFDNDAAGMQFKQVRKTLQDPASCFPQGMTTDRIQGYQAG